GAVSIQFSVVDFDHSDHHHFLRYICRFRHLCSGNDDVEWITFPERTNQIDLGLFPFYYSACPSLFGRAAGIAEYDDYRGFPILHGYCFDDFQSDQSSQPGSERNGHWPVEKERIQKRSKSSIRKKEFAVYDFPKDTLTS